MKATVWLHIEMRVFLSSPVAVVSRRAIFRPLTSIALLGLSHMPSEKKRDKIIKDGPVTRLLDDFTDPTTVSEEASRTDMTDEEYIEMMVKKELERKLMRKHRDGPVEILGVDTEEVEEPPPEIPEGSCPSCQYCTIIKKIGEAVFCVCANTEREVDGMYFDHRMWVRSKSDLGCHKEPPTSKFQKQLRQHLEEQQLKKVANEPEISIIVEKEKSLSLIPEVSNFFEQDMVRVEQELVRIEDEVVIEEPDVPTVFIRPPDPRKRLVENVLVDDFLNKESTALYKHNALETLKKYRRDIPLKVCKGEEALEGPIVSEKIVPLKRCENCYFCVDNKRVGGSSWCHCTNLARSTESATAASWVRSRLNAPCWRREESLSH